MEIVKAPAIGYSITVQLDDKRGIVAQVFVERDSSIDDINVQLDKVMGSIDRQSLVYELEVWKRRVFSDKKNIEELQRSTAAVQSSAHSNWGVTGRKGTFKLTDKERQTLEGFKTGLERSTESIKLAEERIAEIEQKLKPAKSVLRDVA